MRKTLVWLGWILLIALPLAYGVQVLITEDLPPIESWKWSLWLATIVVIFFARNRDDVLRHRLV